MHRRVSLLILVVVFAQACSTAGNSRPPNIAAPAITPELVGSVFFGSGSSAPANIDVTITNRANVPIVVRRLEVDSPGMSTYAIQRTSRQVRETIAAGETKTVTVFATAYTSVRNPSEPLTLRVIADFENGKDRWREIVTR